MNFQVVCKLEENVISKKTNAPYDRVIIDFGDFSKIVVLSRLELSNLKSKLEKKENE